jgi:hypothetical protein
MRRLLVLCVVVLAVARTTAVIAADDETTVSASDSGLSGLVTHLVREQLPHEYEKKKNWDQTKEIFDGWRVSRDGLRVSTKRKTRAVNHGTWTMYRIRLTRPGEFSIRITNLRRLADGRAGFDAEISAPLEVFGRLSQWNLGVQLVSLSADCDARAKLTASLAVRLKLDSSGKLVPDVLIEPEIVSARLELDDFRLRRLSQAHGPLVKLMGKEAREVIEDELAERNGELAAKLNRQIAKKQDKLRLSLSDLAGSKFREFSSFVQEKQ